MASRAPRSAQTLRWVTVVSCVALLLLAGVIVWCVMNGSYAAALIALIPAVAAIANIAIANRQRRRAGNH